MSAYSDRIIADGCSNYWRLAEPSGTTAVDMVGGANGTISGGVTLNQPGALSDGTSAMAFNGTTGKIVTASITVPVVASVEGWVRVSAGTSTAAYPPIWSSRGSSTGSNFGLLIGPSKSLEVYGNSPSAATYTTAVLDGAWHHIVLVLDGTTAAIYIDGVLDVRGPQPFPRTTPSAGISGIGFDAEGTIYGVGTLDEVAIYPRALTAAEVSAHYALRLASASAWPGVPWWVQIQGEHALDKYNCWEPITPSDTVNLPRGLTGGVWVGATGDVAAVMQNNTMPVVLAAVPAGAWLPIAARRINATGTTATGLVALYEI